MPDLFLMVARARSGPAAFTREEWFLLPLEFRQRWWHSTDYGRNEPVEQLIAEGRQLLEALEAKQ